MRSVLRPEYMTMLLVYGNIERERVQYCILKCFLGFIQVFNSGLIRQTDQTVLNNMRETLHITPIFSLFVWLQSVFKDISYMVDPQNKVQVLDRDHVRSSLSIFPSFHQTKIQTRQFFLIYSLICICVLLFVQKYKLRRHLQCLFCCLSLSVFSAFYFSCRVSCLKPCFIQMHHHDVTKIILFHNFILAAVLQGISAIFIYIYVCVCVMCVSLHACSCSLQTSPPQTMEKQKQVW